MTRGSSLLIARARRFYELTGPLRESRSASYVIGLATTGLALLAHFLLARHLAGFPFLVLFPAILFTSFICGWRAGAVAAVFGGLGAWYFWGDDLMALSHATVAASWAGFALYAFAVLIVLGLVGSMHLAFRGFLDSERQRKHLNEELEYRVLARTAELESANLELRREAESRAAAEAQVRQMQKMEAVGQLTGGIAHDFNNMLAVIVGSLDIARRSLAADPHKTERFIANAMEGAQRGAQLTSRLLAFSRQQSLDPKPLDANKLVREMSELLMRSLGENVRLETVLAAGLWQINVDAAELESVVVNLCVNSRDAMPGGGRLTLETMNTHLDDDYARLNADVRPGQYVAIAVTDTGGGMSAEVAARAFDPFFTTKPAGQGTGLGLSQAYGFVRQSGGHIKIYSEINKGTSVCIYLPRYFGEETQGIVVPPMPLELPAVKHEVILVVEDEERVRTMTVEALRSLGYQVLAADGPRRALDQVAQNPKLDLLFTDIVMPGMDGRALAELVQIDRPELKVLYTTGYTRNSVIHHGVVERDVAVLRKPFTVEQLALKVRQVLDSVTATGSAYPVL